MSIQKNVQEYIFYCRFECHFSVHTINAYQSDIDHFFRYVGKKTLDKVMQVDSLKNYLSFMLRDRKLSVATARRRIASLRGFCRYIASQDIVSDPFEKWSPSLKRPKKLPRALPRKAVRQLVKLSDQPSEIEAETVFCILLLGATGLRVAELCNISVCDVAKDGTAIHICGKGSKERIVYVGNKELRARLVEHRLHRFDEGGFTASLLLNSRGGKLQPQTLRRRLHGVASARGFITPVTPHCLRHTAATLLLENGADVRFVQRQLGHASISTTEIYTHVTDTALRRAINRADPMVGLI